MKFTPRHAGLIAVVAAVAAGTTIASNALHQAGAAEAPKPAAVPGQAQAPASVTLITGDRVDVSADGHLTIRRAKGREQMTFLTSKERGQQRVMPADVLPYLRAGKLDARLFNITELVKARRGSGRETLPLIVTAPANGPARLAKPAAPAGVTGVRTLPGSRAIAARADRPANGALWKSIRARGTGKDAPQVWLDGVRPLALDVSVPQVGAPAAWQAGFRGTGVTVAVLDSGVDATHPDLAGQVAAKRNFVEGEDELDRVGHGTHVAATIAGTGAGPAGQPGVAPGARLLDGKVCGEWGCPESAILAGMHWAVTEEKADVVNLSLGGGDEPGVDPIEQAVQDLSAQGTLFVIAAGNAGMDSSVGSPGSADAALTVAAVDDAGQLARFSSRGPRVGDAALKPDIAAPGVGISAARSSHSEGEGSYVTHSGTSMATPHVAGAAAILAQRHPDWSPDQLKAALMASAKPIAGTGVYGQGAGMLGIPAALDQTVTTSPASVSFGRAVWPHPDDAPLTRTLTYRNTGASPMAVDLAIDATGPDGKPAPAGMFALSAATLTVPAGGTASVAVTADTRTAGPDGFAGGNVTATVAGKVIARTPFAVDKEKESYDLTVSNLNKAGEATSQFITRIINLDTADNYFLYDDPDGTATIRLPKGRYFVHGTVFDGSFDDESTLHTSELIQPQLALGRDHKVTMDARMAKAVSARIPAAAQKQINADFYYGVRVGTGSFVYGMAAPSFSNMSLGNIGSAGSSALTVRLGGQWAQATPDGSVHQSPRTYNLAWVKKSRNFNGFSRTVHPRDLAAVHVNYRSQVGGGAGERSAASQVGDIVYGSSATTTFTTPFSRVEYFNGGDGLRWTTAYRELRAGSEEGGEPLHSSIAMAQDYQPGRSYRETWAAAVFGPAIPGVDGRSGGWAIREGNTIWSAVPMFGDGAGHPGISAATGTVTLSRDGEQIGQSELSVDPARFAVASEAGRYRLEVVANRSKDFTLSTRVSSAWDFSSGQPTDVVPLPLLAVRFTPKLGENDTAPAGRPFTIPVTVQAHPGTNAAIRSIRVEVSYDDGKTWRAADMAGGNAFVRHPGTAGFVSLRAKAAGADGNAVEQTIIRAYRIR